MKQGTKRKASRFGEAGSTSAVEFFRGYLMRYSSVGTYGRLIRLWEAQRMKIFTYLIEAMK